MKITQCGWISLLSVSVLLFSSLFCHRFLNMHWFWIKCANFSALSHNDTCISYFLELFLIWIIWKKISAILPVLICVIWAKKKKKKKRKRHSTHPWGTPDICNYGGPDISVSCLCIGLWNSLLYCLRLIECL